MGIKVKLHIFGMIFQSLVLSGIFLQPAESRPEAGNVALDPDNGNFPMETEETEFQTDSLDSLNSGPQKFDPYDPNYTEKGHKPGTIFMEFIEISFS
jgi:hypothetical protein